MPAVDDTGAGARSCRAPKRSENIGLLITALSPAWGRLGWDETGVLASLMQTYGPILGISKPGIETVDDFIQLLRLTVLYEANGLLALSYVIWENITTLLTAVGFLVLGWQAPLSQRVWIAGAGALAALATTFAPPPVPILLTGMTLTGMGAVAADRFAPDALRWRVVGGLALYAAGALAYLAYSYYLTGVDAAAWAEAIGGQAEAQATLAQGRSFLNTLAIWGLWLILPLGFLSLLVQGLLAHPPSQGRPSETIATVRTRGR